MPLELGILFSKSRAFFSPVLPCRCPVGIMGFKKKPRWFSHHLKALGAGLLGIGSRLSSSLHLVGPLFP